MALPKGHTMCHCDSDHQLIEKCINDVFETCVPEKDSNYKCIVSYLSEYHIKSVISVLVANASMEVMHGSKNPKVAITSIINSAHQLVENKVKEIELRAAIDMMEKMGEYPPEAMEKAKAALDDELKV